MLLQEQSMSEMLKVKVRLPADRVDQGNYVIESMDSSDEGRYICRATNSLGTAQAFVDVNMLGMSSALYSYNATLLLYTQDFIRRSSYSTFFPPLTFLSIPSFTPPISCPIPLFVWSPLIQLVLGLRERLNSKALLHPFYTPLPRPVIPISPSFPRFFRFSTAARGQSSEWTGIRKN